MIKYCHDLWNKNLHKLRNQLETDTSLNLCDYKYLIELITKNILGEGWDATRITVVDNGGYHGTQLFLIPRNTYQPSKSDYIMTFVSYGFCSCCDRLLSIQDLESEDKTLEPDQVNDFTKLCKDLVDNMICPYNVGWNSSSEFNPVET